MSEPQATYMQTYYKNNKEKCKQLIKNWHDRNPDYYKKYYASHKRYTICQGCGNKYTSQYYPKHKCITE